VEKWTQAIANNDAVGVNYRLDLVVTAGDNIEFSIEPGPNYYYDSTKFTAVITSQL